MNIFATSRVARTVFALIVVPVLWLDDRPVWNRVLVIAVVVGYMVFSATVETFGIAARRDVATALGALACATALFFSLMHPEMRVGALLGYLIIVAYTTGTGDQPAGYIVAGIAIVVGVGSELVFDEPMAKSVLALFAVSVIVLAVLVEALKKRAESSARMLRRVHEAMMSVTTSPDFDETLDSVAVAASRAVQGTGSGILLREGDHLVLAAPTSIRDSLPSGVVARSTRVELHDPLSSPLAACFLRGETVVVPDIDADETFSIWAHNYRKRVGLPSHAIVAIPLWAGDEVVGAMQTLFPGPIPDQHDTVRLLEAYAEQVTLVIVRTQAYEQERRAAERLGEANQMRSDFLALVSHELRTPLTAAKGFVDTVLYQWDRLDEDRRKELLGRASRNAEELTRLIDKLLAYSGLEAHPVLDVRPVALAEAIEHVREHCAPALGDHCVIANVPDGLYARADAHAFGHLVENLLTNAAKFAPEGTPIVVRAALENDEIVVGVTDEGPGIPESEQEAVFERFYRSPAHRSASRGTGLGLTIARRAADALGGRLWVESELGHGATFVFTLPAATVEAGPSLTPSAATDRLDQPV